MNDLTQQEIDALLLEIENPSSGNRKELDKFTCPSCSGSTKRALFKGDSVTKLMIVSDTDQILYTGLIHPGVEVICLKCGDITQYAT